MEHLFKRSYLAVIVVLFIACGLRAPGIFWGDGYLPNNEFARWHSDESTHVNIAKQFLKRDIDYGSDYIKGFGLQMALGAAVKAKAVSHVSTDDLYRIGRWLSFLYGAAIIVMVYVGAIMISGNISIALIAAGFMSVCSPAITNSHFAVADSAGSFWFWLTALLCYYGLSKHSDKAKLCAWAACGMSLAIKVSVPACAPIIIMVVAGGNRLKNLSIGSAITFTVFMLANGCGVGIGGLWAIFGKIFNDSIAIIPHHTRSETLFTLLISIFPSFSLPIVLLTIGGSLLALKNVKRRFILALCLAAPVIIHVVLLSMLDDPFERHLLPLAPIFCGLSAFCCKKLILDNKNSLIKWSLSISLGLYLILFAVDGEMPFWRDNRVDARQWVINEVEPGSSVLEGPYAWLYLPVSKYKIDEIPLRSYEVPKIDQFDLLILHEFHTYRYDRSRLSPFVKPSMDNIYHPDGFSLEYLDKLRSSETGFKLTKVFPAPKPWSFERALYKKYWGSFQCFAGDVSIYLKK